MFKQIGRESKAILLLIAALQLTSAATFMHGKPEIVKPSRDQLLAKVYGEMGATMMCLECLERTEVNEKISRVWHEHLDRIQLHPTKPSSPSVAMDVLFETLKITLNQLQAIDEKCLTAAFQCHKDAVESDNKTPKDLIDMATSLTMLADTMDCVLKAPINKEEIYRIFDNSLERMHSNYDAVTTPLRKVYEEILQTRNEIKNLSENCMEIDMKRIIQDITSANAK